MKTRLTILIALASAVATTPGFALEGEYAGNFRSQLVVTKCGSASERYDGYLDLNPDGTWALYDELSSAHNEANDALEELDLNGFDDEDNLNDDDLPLLTGTYDVNKARGPITLTVDQAARDFFEDNLERDVASRCGDAEATVQNTKKAKLRIVSNKRGDRVRYEEENHADLVDDVGGKHKAKYKAKATLVKQSI